EEKPLPLPAGTFAAPKEPGRHNARIVEDKQVARSEQLGQIAEGAVLQRLLGAADDQQARGIASRGRLLSDEMLRQRVVEEVRTHEHTSSHEAPARVTQARSASEGHSTPKRQRGRPSRHGSNDTTRIRFFTR